MAETRGSSTPGRPADPLLDFLSPEFSAEKALVSSPSRIRLPCPEVQPCDNLGHYTSVVQGLSRRREATSSRGEVKEEESERVAVRGRKKPVKTVMSVMESMCGRSSIAMCKFTVCVCVCVCVLCVCFQLPN